MLERLDAAQVPVAWVVADSVCGDNLDLRIWLEERAPVLLHESGRKYGSGRYLDYGGPQASDRALTHAQLLSAPDWQQLSMSEGTQLFCLPWESLGFFPLFLFLHDVSKGVLHEESFVPGLDSLSAKLALLPRLYV